MISIDIHYLDDLIRNPCHHLLIQGQWLSIVACGQFELSIPIGQKPLWLLRSKDGFNENEYSFPRSRETSPGRGLLKKTHDSYIYINHGQIMYYHVIFANWSHDLMFLVSSKTKLPTYPFDIFKAAISETRHYDITMRHSVQTILTQHTFRLCLAEHLVTGFLGDRNQDLT